MQKSDQFEYTSPLNSVTSDAVSLFRDDVLDGLNADQKFLPSKYLYDERGSRLFDRICELDEYYPTRTETQITIDNADSIGECIGSNAVIVEYGSGSSTKTRVLLDHLEKPRAYMPVDISEDHLLCTSRKLQGEYPWLDIHPVVADFTSGFDLPADLDGERICVYFPGSTIGNLEEYAATELLQRIAWQCGPGGGALIGFDLQKSKEVLELAYNDPHGVTAEFSLNVLRRINRDLQADFDLSQYEHCSFYNEAKGRIEIYIESLVDEVVEISGEQIQMKCGERIHTEYSHKYTIDGFAQMAAEAGLIQNRVWTDDREYFALMHLKAQ